MKTKWILLMIIGIGMLLNSCEEFIERDISDQWVYALSPPDFAVTDALNTTFKWKEVKGASSYNLQLFRTDSTYLHIKEFLVDTNVRTTQFEYALGSGYYRWHIYGKNNGGETGLSIFRFQVDSTTDITKQKIVLIAPINGYIADNPKVEFRWKKLPSADSYEFQIYRKGEQQALFSKLIDEESLTYTFKSEKESYVWTVRALKGSFSSQKTEFALTVDTSRLATPMVISPKNDTTTINKLPVQLKWGSVPNAIDYTVQVSEDSTYSESQMDVKTVKDLFYDYSKADKSKRYYWRVKANKGTVGSKYSKWWYFMYK